mgnify:CR=1 FL=1|tara:strand:+ start:9106 stop:11031 length:1926 start_codon:yes stop_codon:yes gene_type:complete
MDSKTQIRSYGSWSSPISADSLVKGVSTISDIKTEQNHIWWSESRPEEGGRVAVVCLFEGQEPQEITPAEANVRSKVHEYGGGAWWIKGKTLFYVNYDDQRIRKIEPGLEEKLLTPEPPEGESWRFADGRITPDGQWCICVREIHHYFEGHHIEPDNQLVAIKTDGTMEINELVVGADFYAFPRPSPDGEFLAWIQWNHPSMPWWGTELWIGHFEDGLIKKGQKVAGGHDESVIQPEWSSSSDLFYLSDRSGWSNLYKFSTEEDELIIGGEFDIGMPLWVFDQSRYALLEEGNPVASVTAPDGETYLATPSSLTPSEWSSIHQIRISADDDVILLAASHKTGPSIIKGIKKQKILKSPKPHKLDNAFLAAPELVEFPTLDGNNAYVRYYSPAHSSTEAPDDELPPLLVLAHGGPTASTRNELSLALRYWTSRGWAVADVDYRGSTGYGRSYMNALDGKWGLIDVADCVAAARFLVAEGQVDANRIAIKGGSAGGLTVLAALSGYDDFSAGSCRYGVADLEILANDTHKFESRYLDRLVGKYPQDRDTYVARSPIHQTETFKNPMIILQGSEDAVVPPNQSELIVEALKSKGIKHSYLLFEGEGHGFRKSENIVRALESEYSFFSQIFGFEPFDDIELTPIL